MTAKTTPSRSYRLPQRTLDNLDLLIENHVARNATEAIILAVEDFASKHRPPAELEKIEELLPEALRRFMQTDEGKELLASYCKPEPPKRRSSKQSDTDVIATRHFTIE